VAGNLSYPLPSNAFVGGLDPYGYKLYVGRVIYSGSVVPCRVVAETGIASCNTDSLPYTARTYQLLTTKDDMDYEWIRSYDGILEENAVSVGTSAWNERVFICRAQSSGGVIIGSLFLTKKTCVLQAVSHEYIQTFSKYEVLVAQPKSNGTYY